MEGTLRCTLESQEQHVRSIQQSTSNHTKHFHSIHQQNNNHIQTNTVKRATHKTNRSTHRITHKIQGYNITLTTIQVQESIIQSKNNNSQGPDKLNIRHLNT